MSFGHNKEFLKDPVAYLGGITVLTIGTRFLPSPAGFAPQVAKPLVYMDLCYLGVGLDTRQGRADFSAGIPGGDDPIPGAWIPYEPEGTVATDIGKLPAQVLPAGGLVPFAFTGAINGCSLVMATKGGADYGIHVPNSSQATQGYPFLAQAGYTYVKSVDYYQIDQRRQGFYGTRIGASRDAPGGGWYNTFAFFYFSGGEWKIIAQPQIVTAIDGGTRFVGKASGPVIVV